MPKEDNKIPLFAQGIWTKWRPCAILPGRVGAIRYLSHAQGGTMFISILALSLLGSSASASEPAIDPGTIASQAAHKLLADGTVADFWGSKTYYSDVACQDYVASVAGLKLGENRSTLYVLIVMPNNLEGLAAITLTDEGANGSVDGVEPHTDISSAEKNAMFSRVLNCYLAN